MIRAMQIDFFETEIACIYRGEDYLVRDSGAIFRQSRPDKRKRPLDEIWTFGTPSKSDGYMSISAHKVHRIVATAFHGPPPSKDHVVDHIDTNRRNNRSENLRWVTRLENILLNPITAKRVEHHYGSIENFLADPNGLRNGRLTKDFEWMRAVTPAEAEYSRKRLFAWAQSSGPSSGHSLGDWIFGRSLAQEKEETHEQLVPSKTPGAVQRFWKVPAEFPACPSVNEEKHLESYFGRLKVGEVFAISPFGQTNVGKAAMTSDGTALFVLGEHEGDSIKPWSLAQVTVEDGRFVHESCGTFFEHDGAKKQFVLAQGLPWEGGDTIDGFC